jgi:hypothetical protein
LVAGFLPKANQIIKGVRQNAVIIEDDQSHNLFVYFFLAQFTQTKTLTSTLRGWKT